MELRPRCTTCRQTGHTMCPPIPPIPIQRRSRVIRNRAPVVAQKCCSFCCRPGHYKPKCEKYKIFVQEVKPHDVSNFMIVVIDRLIKDMQNMFLRFMRSQFSNQQIFEIFEMTEEGFRHFVQIFLHAFDEPSPRSQPPSPRSSRSQPPSRSQPQANITVKLHETNSKIRYECGICLMSNIPCSKMVKLGCGHEFCGGCAEKFINVKPCCAFCRADVTNVTVASKSMQTKFKKNKKFVVEV
jgi:hypothetical protein